MSAIAPVLPLITEGGVPPLDVKNLTAVYRTADGREVHAVDDLSFTIADKPGVGEVVVLLGPSGSGKSTILRCVAGLLRPTSGTVQIRGAAVTGPSRAAGMVFQQYTAFDWLTVRENVEYGPRLAGVSAPDRRRRAEEALVAVGLTEFARAYPKALSGGQKQRVAIARTLVNSPRLLLMDEPFGALDPQTRWGMQSLLLDLAHKLDNTTVLVTHDVTEAVYVADTIFILSQRPARILHRIEVPHFEARDHGLRQDKLFRDCEAHVLGLLARVPGNVRVS